MSIALSAYKNRRRVLLPLLYIFHLWPLLLESANVITLLPGFRGKLPFKLETGYVTVDEVSDSEIFYYFIESEKSPKVDPLLFWITGGPGCSGLSPLLAEIGPLNFKIDPYNASKQILPTLVSNPYSWTKLSSIVFVDSPVGSGFSFSTTSDNLNIWDDQQFSDQLFTFVIKWFVEHPHFASNPVYIAGDSYGGKIIPILAEKLAEGKDTGMQPSLNLKGYIVGNPASDGEDEYRVSVAYGLGLGVISYELFLAIRTSCAEEVSYSHRTIPGCAANLDMFDEFLKEIAMDDLSKIACPVDFDPWKKRLFKPLRRSYLLEGKLDGLYHPPPTLTPDCPNYAHYLVYYWANNPAVREALHIKEGTVDEWVRCNFDLPYNASIIQSSVHYHFDFINRRKYRALVYNGDHDMIVPFLSTTKWIRSLNLSIVDKWRSWHVDGQVAGYTELYSGNLTFATVKGGGHEAPSGKPVQCFAMIERWLSGKSL